ncbi:hypothetical protein JNM05_07330, partial [bacterium]|nr:hypothetical protein [bacterium]
MLEIGRIFYHLNQRRGFKSSRKGGGVKDEDNSEDSKIFQGDEKTRKIGIAETKKYIEAENETLGKYLSSLVPDNIPYKENIRIRNRYTTREMYVLEFNKIWDSQQKFYPEILKVDLRRKIGDEKEGILFFQRPLKSQKYLIGKCTFERDKPRCPESAIPFELYRTYSFINSIQILGSNGQEVVLTVPQRESIVDIFNSKDKFDFKLICKTLGFGDSYRFNYDLDSKVVGNNTISSLSKVFGKDVWFGFSEKEQEDIWHNVFFADDSEWLIGNMINKPNQRWADQIRKWKLSEKQIKALQSIKLRKDYANLSRKAINNILPYLQKGFIYSDAVLLGGIRNAFGALKWSELSEQAQLDIENEVIQIARANREGNSLEKIKNFLKTSFKLNEKRLKKLYHHSNPDEKDSPTLDVLPEPDNLRNPIVQQAMYELRNLINNIIEEYGKPDEIRVELARELKASRKKRDEIHFENRKREKENDKIKKELDKLSLDHTRENIQKYILWSECQHTCPYTGKEINVNDLFAKGHFQIEH